MKSSGEAGAVLLAEDNPHDVLLAERSFEVLGVNSRLHVVPDGFAVLQYLKGEGSYYDRNHFPLPKLILLDLDMPRMNGFEVLAWLRKQSDLRQLPVVVLTASVFSPDIALAYQLGANSFLTKPHDFTDYVAALKQVLDFWLDGDRPLKEAA